jgi:hypothetical protein
MDTQYEENGVGDFPIKDKNLDDDSTLDKIMFVLLKSK